jgi:hypothetical protein
MGRHALGHPLDPFGRIVARLQHLPRYIRAEQMMFGDDGDIAHGRQVVQICG